MNCNLRPRRRHAGPRMECKNRAMCFLAHWVKIRPGILHIKLQMNVKLWNQHIVHLKKLTSHSSIEKLAKSASKNFEAIFTRMRVHLTPLRWNIIRAFYKMVFGKFAKENLSKICTMQESSIGKQLGGKSSFRIRCLNV